MRFFPVLYHFMSLCYILSERIASSPAVSVGTTIRVHHADGNDEECDSTLLCKSLDEVGSLLRKYEADVTVLIETNVSLTKVFEVSGSNIHIMGVSTILYVDCGSEMLDLL